MRQEKLKNECRISRSVLAGTSGESDQSAFSLQKFWSEPFVGIGAGCFEFA